MKFRLDLQSQRFELDGGWLFRRLLALAGLLMAAHAVFVLLVHHAAFGRGLRFLSLLNLDEEQGPGTWVASLLLLAIAGLLFWIARAARADRRHWWWLGALALAMSCDEVAGVHERLNVLGALARRAGVDPGPWFYFTWTLPALIGLVALAAVYGAFLWRLAAPHRLRLLAAAGCYFGGAVGVEIWESALVAAQGNQSALYAWCVLAEEGAELLGLALGFRAVLGIATDGSVVETGEIS